MNIDMSKIKLDVDLAIPIGLIVNELISNALKYAFPKQEKGEIRISLYENGEILLLEVADNGVGIQPDIIPIGTGFGSELISLLTRQLDGKMTLIKSPGATFTFKFLLTKAA
jgi:two-component sensor histidine kinase